MNVYWPFLMAAIICAVLSDQISKAARTDTSLKKVILTVSAGVGLICAIAIITDVLHPQ